MAMKDWTKWMWREKSDVGAYFSWRHKKKEGHFIAVLDDEDNIGKNWEVQIYPSGGIKPVKSFKTKSQALGYAKQYMRTH